MQSHGKESECTGKRLGSLIYSLHLAYFFSHLTRFIRTSYACLSNIQDPCLPNNHSHIRQLKLLVLLTARNKDDNQENQEMWVYINRDLGRWETSLRRSRAYNWAPMADVSPELHVQVAKCLVRAPYLCFLLRSMNILLDFSCNGMHFDAWHIPSPHAATQ